MSRIFARSGDVAVGEGTRVTLHFAIQLTSGEEIDTTRRGKPATFTVGDGNLLPGFEQALFGLKAGDDEQIRIAAEDAFGIPSETNVQRIPRARFADDVALEPGLIVSFSAPDGELPGVVREIDGDLVEVDFNHPLAGRNLVFDVTILRVDPV